MEGLIYNEEYHLWRDGEYIGTAFWKQDDNIGDGFQKEVINSRGQLVSEVYLADSWNLIKK